MSPLTQTPAIRGCIMLKKLLGPYRLQCPLTLKVDADSGLARTRGEIRTMPEKWVGLSAAARMEMAPPCKAKRTEWHQLLTSVTPTPSPASMLAKSMSVDLEQTPSTGRQITPSFFLPLPSCFSLSLLPFSPPSLPPLSLPLPPSLFLSYPLSLFYFFETESYSIAQDTQRLMTILLPQSPECWNYGSEPPCLTL